MWEDVSFLGQWRGGLFKKCMVGIIERMKKMVGVKRENVGIFYICGRKWC
jgi:hypothetical protein